MRVYVITLCIVTIERQTITMVRRRSVCVQKNLIAQPVAHLGRNAFVVQIRCARLVILCVFKRRFMLLESLELIRTTISVYELIQVNRPKVKWHI